MLRDGKSSFLTLMKSEVLRLKSSPCQNLSFPQCKLKYSLDIFNTQWEVSARFNGYADFAPPSSLDEHLTISENVKPLKLLEVGLNT